MPDNFKLVLRATQNDSYIEELVGKFGISSIISIKPPVSYHEALSEMLTADGLLVIQAENCNMQIPAKLYEYIRARRPILALTDSKGDTANKLLSLGIKPDKKMLNDIFKICKYNDWVPYKDTEILSKINITKKSNKPSYTS